MLAPEISANDENLTENQDPKVKTMFTKMKKDSRGGRRAKRAGFLDACPSSGARSAPELRLASDSRGLDSNPDQIRKCQPLNVETRYVRKFPKTVACNMGS